MSVGLYDMDFQNYLNVPFNLELMKLSAYYKKRREIVIFSPSFTPDRHSKFFIRKDYYDGNFPKGLELYSNIEFGGRAFNPECYVPLKEEIETMRGDKIIYENKEDNYGFTQQNGYNSLLKGEHCRLSLDNKTIWKNWEKQVQINEKTRLIYFHDYNLAEIDGAPQLIEAITKEKIGKIPLRFGNKFPIIIKDSKDFVQWARLRPNGNLFTIQYNGLMNNDDFLQFVESEKYCVHSSSLTYNVTQGCINEKDFIQNRLRKLFRQLLIAHLYRARIKIKINESFFENEEWTEVIRMFNYYAQSYDGENDEYLKNDTIFKFLSNLRETQRTKHSLTQSQASIILNFIKHNCPELFEDFYLTTIQAKEELYGTARN